MTCRCGEVGCNTSASREVARHPESPPSAQARWRGPRWWRIVQALGNEGAVQEPHGRILGGVKLAHIRPMLVIGRTRADSGQTSSDSRPKADATIAARGVGALRASPRTRCSTLQRGGGLCSMLQAKTAISWEDHVLRRSDRQWMKALLDVRSAEWLAARRASHSHSIVCGRERAGLRGAGGRAAWRSPVLSCMRVSEFVAHSGPARSRHRRLQSAASSARLRKRSARRRLEGAPSSLRKCLFRACFECFRVCGQASAESQLVGKRRPSGPQQQSRRAKLGAETQIGFRAVATGISGRHPSSSLGLAR